MFEFSETLTSHEQCRGNLEGQIGSRKRDYFKMFAGHAMHSLDVNKQTTKWTWNEAFSDHLLSLVRFLGSEFNLSIHIWFWSGRGKHRDHLNWLKRSNCENTLRLRLKSGTGFAEFVMVRTSHLPKSSEVKITFWNANDVDNSMDFRERIMKTGRPL